MARMSFHRTATTHRVRPPSSRVPLPIDVFRRLGSVTLSTTVVREMILMRNRTAVSALLKGLANKYLQLVRERFKLHLQATTRISQCFVLPKNTCHLEKQKANHKKPVLFSF